LLALGWMLKIAHAFAAGRGAQEPHL
jgi:hypothetical protein